jgi:hypothetical protein
MRSLNRSSSARTAARVARQPGTAVALVVAAALVALALVIAAMATAPAAYARSSDNGASFAVRCDFSHRNLDDPIAHPGEEGAAHSHDFFGNVTTNAHSTYENMLGQDTTCTHLEDTAADTAAYWMPTVYWNGEQLTSNRAVFYYRTGGKNHTTVRPYPAGLKVITASERYISWRCGRADNGKGTRNPPTQCDTGELGVRIIFPDCSNGKANSANHKSHMAHSRLIDGKVRCPRSHPKPVPVLTMNVTFPIPIGETGEVTLSSDKPGDPGGSTMHADFWNTWDQATLKHLVTHCINKVPPSKPRPPECQARGV